MVTIQLQDGTKINFANNPSPEDIDFAYKQIQSQKVNNNIKPIETPPETGLKGVATGIGKGILSTAKGIGQFGEKVGQTILGGVEKVTGLKVKPDSVYSEEALQKNKEEGGVMGTLLNEKNLEAKGTAENIGKIGEQTAEFLIPGTKVSKLTEGANLVSKIIPRVLTSGSIATLQSGDIGVETAIASGIETALPVAGAILKPATKLISGLFRNIGSALSGVPVKTLTKIMENPEVAQDTIRAIKESGSDKILVKNAETYINGVKQIKKEASSIYSKGLESLEKTDINPTIVKDEIKSVIQDNKGIISDTGFSLKNTEFSNDKKLIKNASDLINSINNSKDLSGRGIKKLMDIADGIRLKTATTDASISFNSFIDDISNGLKNAIGKSTDKLDEINKIYSTDINLANGIQTILGKVKYGIKNDSELIDITKKLDTLFNKKGISEMELDKFLNRIGIKPEDFKTSEAVRQISNIEAGANTIGANRSELIKSASASILTPTFVRDIAVLTGKTEQIIKPILEKLSPSARVSLIEILTPSE